MTMDHFRLIERIYDGAADPTGYPAIAADISRAVGLDGATLVLHETHSRRVLSATMVHYDHLAVDEVLTAYGRDWHAENPQVLFEANRAGADIYFEGCDPIYNTERFPGFDLWRRSELGIRSQITGYCRPDDDLTFAFAFSSHHHDGPESAAQLDLFRRIMGHLRQSVGLAYRIGTLNGESDALLRHLEQLSGPLLILDAQGAPTYVNAHMEAALAGHPLLRLGRQGAGRTGLTSPDPALDRRLRQLIARAVGQPPGGGAMLIPGDLARGPLVLQVAPLTNAFRDRGLETGQAVVTLANWPRPQAELAEKFRETLGLTPAEARIATWLMRGATDLDIATELKVSPTTIRSHISGVMEKTGLRSKAELAHFLTLLGR
ncbi:helix-turn-helix transcriptional regulator [Phenylobacterium sp.]|jgi:DNA-binding CsgD family transcriptional regulator|uniref:helix-turn-helix transcriptional regulator n=1 Tax=Phenylobacterium sp. TaxID=1871053 RepID=UPI0037C98504